MFVHLFMQALLPTRRFFNTLVDDHHLVVSWCPCVWKLSPSNFIVHSVTSWDCFNTVNPLLSPHNPPSSNKPPAPSLFSPPPLFHYYYSQIKDWLYWSITTVKLCVDWSGMVFSPTGCSDLFLTLGCMTFNFLYWAFLLLILVLCVELIPLPLPN